MTSIRQCRLEDLLIFNNVNLDALTETYNGSFYMSYMAQWPESFLIAKSPSHPKIDYYNNSSIVRGNNQTEENLNNHAIHNERLENGELQVRDHHQQQQGQKSDLPQLCSQTTQVGSQCLFPYETAYTERVMGYVLGKAEGDGTLWHGHVSAVTVAPEYRRLGLAKTLMDTFEDVCKHQYNAYFVDLFVRASNSLAIKMYENFGYSTYRRVLGYYSGETPEDALDMRKALPRDVNKESIIPLDHPVMPEDLEW